MIAPTATTARRRWRAPFLGLLAGLLLILLAAYLVASAYLAHSIWYPVRTPLHTTPAAYGLAYQDVSFPSSVDHIPLSGWLMGPPIGKTILVLHGRDSVRDNYLNMELSRALVQHGYSVLDFDFRGHGKSGGDISSMGQLETRDVAGALDYLKSRGATDVGSLGFSMGAATELLAAPEHPELRAIVADSSYADLLTILEAQRAQAGVPSFLDPGAILVSRLFYGLDPASIQPEHAVARLGDRPVLLVHATGDNLIPVTEAYRLQAAGANDPNLQLWVAPGAGHVGAFAANRDEYLRRVLGFFDRYLQIP